MTEYKLVVVGGKPDDFFNFFNFFFNYSWRRGQKRIDNSTYSKSVRLNIK
jgi:hypothetical protein